MKKILPYVLILIFNFYALPFLIQDTGSAIAMLLILIPFICLVCSFVYGAKRGFSIFWPLAVAILFVPTIFIFYNPSAWIYALGYGITALIGNGLGALLHRQVNRKRKD